MSAWSSLPDILTVAGPAAVGLLGAASGLKFVEEGQRGLILRFGKVKRDRAGEPAVVGPGFRILIPTVDRLVRTHVRTRTIDLPPQTVVLKDRTVFEVSGVLLGHVRDDARAIYQALFETDDFEGSIRDYATAQLREVLGGATYEQVLEPKALLDQVNAHVTEQLERWGFTAGRVMLTNCSPTQKTAAAILLTAETSFRVEALNTAAGAVTDTARRLQPTVAAALIGTPVSVALGEVPNQRGGHDGYEEDDDND